MSLVTLACFIAAFRLAADAVAVTSKADDVEVLVGADARQMMRNVNHPATHEKDTNKASAQASSPKKVVNMELFYETRCPDCTGFITDTLAGVWNNADLRSHMNLTINPFGNAQSFSLADTGPKGVSEGYKFWHPTTTGKGYGHVHVCQHGSQECLGNLLQACAISTETQEKYMDLVLCMAAKPTWSIEKSSAECTKSAGIDEKKVRECVTSPAGNQLFESLGKKTAAVPGRKGTPWVLINGENLDNTTDLLRTVCGHLGDDGPGACAPFKAAPAEAPKASREHPGMADGGDFTVLPALQKQKELVKLSPDQI